MDKYGILKHYFGYDSFRTGQEKLVDAILAGQDVLGIMPTGAGKSLCYQGAGIVNVRHYSCCISTYIANEGSGWSA